MSAGMTSAADTELIAKLGAEKGKTARSLDLLWIACGKDDTALAGANALHQALDKAGIKHTYLETGGAHHWRVWRRYLRDLAPLLFK
jgi:enterochelin esterase family protein